MKANKGSPGVDGMSVNQLGAWIKLHKHELIASLADGSYQPQPVRGEQIPKPGGKGMRQLGIPTVIDSVSSGTVGDRAGAGADSRPILFGIELWIPTPTQRARRAEEGKAIRCRGTRYCCGHRP